MNENDQTNDGQPKETGVGMGAPAPSSREQRYERGTIVDVFANHEESGEKHINNDIANNDGSIVATLDNVFHGTAASLDHNEEEGSNRAGYYESKEHEKSDAEEEVTAQRKETE